MSEAPPSLNNEVALITGASRRIGAQIARTLHHAGMNLCLHYRTAEKDALALAKELEANRPDSVQLVSMNLLDIANLHQLIEATVERWGKLNLLINNASSFYPTPVGEITEDNWNDLIGINLKVPLFLSQAAASALQQNDSAGCIINIADIHAERPMEKHIVYSIAKSGLVALTKSLARELGPGIRVNAVAPGAILWPEGDMDHATKTSILDRTALKHTGNPNDISMAVLFLYRDAPYVTGHTLPVDGGRLLHI